MAILKQTSQIITEKVSVKERELFIKRAASDGKVTLLSRILGRGSDFIRRNQQFSANSEHQESKSFMQAMTTGDMKQNRRQITVVHQYDRMVESCEDQCQKEAFHF